MQFVQMKNRTLGGLVQTQTMSNDLPQMIEINNV